MRPDGKTLACLSDVIESYESGARRSIARDGSHAAQMRVNGELDTSAWDGLQHLKNQAYVDRLKTCEAVLHDLRGCTCTVGVALSACGGGALATHALGDCAGRRVLRL